MILSLEQNKKKKKKKKKKNNNKKLVHPDAYKIADILPSLPIYCPIPRFIKGREIISGSFEISSNNFLEELIIINLYHPFGDCKLTSRPQYFKT